MPRLKKDGKYVNFYARKDLMDRLEKYSERTMIPKTAILEAALKEYLDKVVPEKTKAKLLRCLFVEMLEQRRHTCL